MADQTTDPLPCRGWQQRLAESVVDLDELLSRVGLGRDCVGDEAAAREAASQLPVLVPPSFVELIRPGDPDDPLLRQVLPRARERDETPGFGSDPLAEMEGGLLASGTLHKYHGRALMLVTGACAMHCRYCFRRHLQLPARPRVEEACAMIAGEPEIREVILSGGDPLMMDDARLAQLVGRLGSIGHLERLRIHTRMPVVLPERVGSQLLAWVQASRLETVVVVHVNHASELGDGARAALARLRGAGVTLLNQSVLLRGVNDDPPRLVQLSEALFSAGVLPYYIHLLDRVRGASHFEVSEELARQLLGDAAGLLPGYLVPRLVRDLPGSPCKQIIAPAQEPTPR